MIGVVRGLLVLGAAVGEWFVGSGSVGMTSVTRGVWPRCSCSPLQSRWWHFCLPGTASTASD